VPADAAVGIEYQICCVDGSTVTAVASAAMADGVLCMVDSRAERLSLGDRAVPYPTWRVRFEQLDARSRGTCVRMFRSLAPQCSAGDAAATAMSVLHGSCRVNPLMRAQPDVSGTVSWVDPPGTLLRVRVDTDPTGVSRTAAKLQLAVYEVSGYKGEALLARRHDAELVCSMISRPDRSPAPSVGDQLVTNTY
jgi:hypothetical protein